MNSGESFSFRGLAPTPLLLTSVGLASSEVSTYLKGAECTVCVHDENMPGCLLFSVVEKKNKSVVFLCSSLMGHRPRPTVIHLVSLVGSPVVII